MEQDRIECARAGREARDAVARRTSRGPVSREIHAAMAKNLASEAFRSRERDEQRPVPTEQDPDDEGHELR